MTESPENQTGQAQPTPPLQPFTMPSPAPSQPAAPGYQAPAPGYQAPAPPQPAAPGYQARAQAGYQPGVHPPYSGYQPYPAGATAYPGAKDPILAEWWRRLLARVIDGIVIGLLVSPLWVKAWLSVFHTMRDIVTRYPDVNSPGVPPSVLDAYSRALSNLTASMVTWALLLGLVTGAVTFCYDWLQHGLWGQTLGKRALGTKVVRAADRGKVGGGAAAVRAAVYGLAPVVPYIGGLFGVLNELWLTWDPRRQCLHDKAAKTIVVKKAMLEAPPRPPELS